MLQLIGAFAFQFTHPWRGNLSVTSSLLDLTTPRREPMRVTVAAEEVTRELRERGLSVTTDVVVLLEDDVRHPPEFGRSLYVTQLFESPPLGTILNFAPPLETTGQRGTFALSIIGDLASKCFEVEPTVLSGDVQFDIRVKNNQLLDFEKLVRPEIRFRIKAQEVELAGRTRPTLISYTNVTVTVIDQNDNAPAFEKDLYEAFFDENIERGTPILKVAAIDADQADGGRVVYSGLTGDNADDLTLDPTSGQISVKVTNHRFDFETQEEYRLQVFATDSGVPQRTGTASIVLTVRDVNDNPPVFTSPMYSGKLSPKGDKLEEAVQVLAVDRDSGANSKVAYRLRGSSKYRDNFAIDRNTGELSVRKPVPMELTDSRDPRRLPENQPLTFQQAGSEAVNDRIELQVEAHDEGSPQLFSKVPVYIYKKENVQTMTFLVNEDVDTVLQNQDDVERQLSVFTGGTATITNVKRYEGDDELTGRNGQQLEGKTAITARVHRPYDAIFDTTSLGGGAGSKNEDGGTDGGEAIDQAAVNSVWFWLLIALALIIIIILIIVCCCCYCSCCYACCPLCSCYKRKMVKEYDEEAVAYVNVNGGDAQQLNRSHGRGGNVLQRMRSAVAGPAERVRSAASRQAWSGNGRYRQLPAGGRNSHSSTLRLVDAAETEPGRENVVMLRQGMEDEISRVVRGGRDNQIVLVPNEIGSLHRSSSRASRGGPKMYRVMRDGRRQLQLVDEDGYRERRSVVLDGVRTASRRTPSVEVLTLDDQNGGRDAEYHRKGRSDSLRLYTSAKRRQRDFSLDRDGNPIERPVFRGRPRDDQDVRYGQPVGPHRAGPRRRTRSEVMVVHEDDELEEDRLEDEDGRLEDDGGGGKAMIMTRFMNSQEGARYESDQLRREEEEEQLDVQQSGQHGVTVTSLTRRGDVIQGEARVSARAIKTPIQEETQSVLEREEREIHAPLPGSPEPLYAQTKASILRRRNSKAVLQEELQQAGLLHAHRQSDGGEPRRASDDSTGAKKRGAPAVHA
ncbi:uncharacterized protein LOC119092953 [Pollicipes pollicipes]|uniref:uncharacterized protein LOC119092953 n=1 Tax=Pollicipes pollicipes TaxID=41117 RepID=UPI0018858807|nr:uncharacterized protein LOC119092953 [Pollicipes pollicipes]